MNPTTVLQAVQTWPVEDQFDLAFRLWDQLLERGWQPELTEELKAELDRRIASYEGDPTNVFTWEQVLERVRRK